MLYGVDASPSQLCAANLGCSASRSTAAVRHAAPVRFQRQVMGYTLAGFGTTAATALGTAMLAGTGGVAMGLAAVGVLAPAALIVAAAESSRKPPQWRLLACLGSTVGVGLGLGIMLRAAPLGILSVTGVAAGLFGLAAVLSAVTPSMQAARWSRGPGQALRLALNTGAAVATCLSQGTSIALLSASAGLVGAAGSAFLTLMASRTPGSPSDDALSVAMELYAHSISAYAFVWRLMLGSGLVTLQRI